MLQMNKNTNAKIGALLASVVALGSILGLVQRGAQATAAATQPVQSVTAPLSQTNATTQSSQTQSSTAQSAPKVTTRTHVS
jgi:hypothetical protein